MNQQAEVLQGVMKDMEVMGERLRHGMVIQRTVWTALDEMWESLHDVVAELRKEAS